MKLVFVNRHYAPDHSATSQMLTDLAETLARERADVHVVTSRLRYDDTTVLLPRFELLHGVAVHRVPTTRFGRGSLPGRTLDYLSFYLAATAKLFGLLGCGDIVVAKTDPPLISVPAGWVARMRRARSVNWLQDLFPDVAANLRVAGMRGPLGRMLAGLRDGSLRRAARNVVLGVRMRDYLLGRGVDPPSIAVVPNWADGRAIRPIGPSQNTLRHDWGLGGKLVVGYSGNMGRVHEFGTIIDVAAELRDDSGIAFLFIGDGSQRQAIGEAVSERKLPNLVFRPYGPRGDLDRSLGVADIHLVSLRPELEGLVVPSKFYGIAAAGRPTIFVGDTEGEIAVILREAECGLCVRPGDAAGLAAAVLTLRGDPALRERMGRNARKIFDERYDLGIAVGKWQRLLEDVAKSQAV